MAIFKSCYQTSNKKSYKKLVKYFLQNLKMFKIYWLQTETINIKIYIVSTSINLLVISSENFLYKQIWYLKSPPLSKSMTK